MHPTQPPSEEYLARRIGDGVAIVACEAPWPASCRLQRPIVAAVVRDWGGRVRSVFVDVEAESVLARRLGIRTLPTLILYADGRERRRLEGLHPAGTITAALRDILTPATLNNHSTNPI